MKQEKFNTIREIILTEDIGALSRKSSLFGGADISIVPKLPDKKEDFYSSPQFVVTNYAKELSWLIFKLKEIFKNDLDYLNKYPFYGRLAERANNSIESKGDSLTTILLDVLDEAEKMYNEGHK